MSDRMSRDDAKNTAKEEGSVAGATEASTLETELAKFIISPLALEEITADEIAPETPLFAGGLGLDSVDALELAVALQKEYGIKLDPKDESSIHALTCLKNLAALIIEHRKLGAVS